MKFKAFLIAMRHLEAALQESCVAWFRLQFPKRLIFAVPNGARTSIREAVRLKRQGLSAGVPDLCIPEPIGDKHGLFIELKWGKKKATPAQFIWHDRLAANEYATAIVREFEEFKRVIWDYFKGER